MKKATRLRCGYGSMSKILTILLTFMAPATASWIGPYHPSQAVTRRRGTSQRKPLSMTQHEKSDDSDPSSCGVAVSGVSVSPEGFWVLLRVPPTNDSPATKTLAIQVTSSTEDAVAATSAESLTLLQLISGVDMAGPILPPEFLGQVAVLHCEFSSKKSDSEQALLEMIQDTLPEETPYSECNVWQRSRVRFPKLSLDQVRLSSTGENQNWILECSVPQFPQMGRILVKPKGEILQSCVYRYDPATSASFASMALALRYKAPIALQHPLDSNSLLDDDELKKRFPNLRTVSALKSQSERVHENIERGFEIHKLTGALRIAMEKGDTVAAESIRQKLDQYDSMDDLPTLGNNRDDSEEQGGLDQMQ